MSVGFVLLACLPGLGSVVLYCLGMCCAVLVGTGGRRDGNLAVVALRRCDLMRRMDGASRRRIACPVALDVGIGCTVSWKTARLVRSQEGR